MKGFNFDQSYSLLKGLNVLTMKVKISVNMIAYRKDSSLKPLENLIELRAINSIVIVTILVVYIHQVLCASQDFKGFPYSSSFIFTISSFLRS